MSSSVTMRKGKLWIEFILSKEYPGAVGNCGASVRKVFLKFWLPKIFWTSMFQRRSFCTFSIFKGPPGHPALGHL